MEFKQIKSLPNFEISIEGIIRNIKSGAIKSQYIGSTGYYMISVSNSNKSKPHRVHRLLAETYLSNPNNYPEINHMDGIKTNNELSNLEWCTHAQNMGHAFRLGLANNTGENNGQAKLKDEDIPIIRDLLNNGVSQYKIAQRFNVSRSAILNIKTKRDWNHV